MRWHRGARWGWPRRLLALGGTALGALVLVSAYVEWRGTRRIVAAAAAPGAPVALVFGAGLAPRGQPGRVLAERLDAAVRLWREGRVERLLLSGDNSDRYHDETRAMLRYVLEQGVPERAVEGDFAGLSTYDSCVRARHVFGVQRALLVTQRFHLPRALYIANAVGLDAWGVAADERRQAPHPYALREALSRPLALLMVWLRIEPRVPTGRAPPPAER